MNQWELEICSRVKTIRESIKWPQGTFAEQLGITRDQLASIECGRTPLRYEIAWKLSNAFDISLRWLEEGFGFADNTEQDNLPIPTATGFPKRALLSAVVQAFSGFGGKDVVAIGPEVSEVSNKKTLSGLVTVEKSGALNFDNLDAAVDSMMKFLEGTESATGAEDVESRLALESLLKIRISEWISRVPLGHAFEFSEKMQQFAEKLIRSFPEESSDAIERRGEKIMWARIKNSNAKKILIAAGLSKTGLTEVTLQGKNRGVKPQLPSLIQRLKRKASRPGAKAELARLLDVAPARITEWLSGAKEPGGEYTLQLLKWVEQS